MPGLFFVTLCYTKLAMSVGCSVGSTKGFPQEAPLSSGGRRSSGGLPLRHKAPPGSGLTGRPAMDGGVGVFLVSPDGDDQEVRLAACCLCSVCCGYRPEPLVTRTACRYLLERRSHTGGPVVVCTDSQPSLAALREGFSHQTLPLEIEIWESRASLACSHTKQIFVQWVWTHCDIPGNERADTVAKETARLG